MAQMTALEKQSAALRREVQSATTDYKKAKKQKAPLEAPLARELNARADGIMALSRILVLANALGDKKKVKATTKVLRAEAKAYNNALRALPKEQRKLIVPMSETPDVSIIRDGMLPSLTRMSVQTPEAEIVILPSPTQDASVRQAMASATAVVAPEEFYIPSHATSAVAPARLPRKEATKQLRALEHQDTEMRRRLANAEAARLTARRAKKSTTSSTVAALNARAEVIEINARMLALAKSQGLKQAEKKATRAIDTEVRTYNADARAISKSERIRIAPLPERLSESIAKGVPMASIPRIRLDEARVDLTEFATAPVVQRSAEVVIPLSTDTPAQPTSRRGASRSTTTVAERPDPLYATTTSSYDNKQISVYLQKQQKSIIALKKERTKEERRTSTLKGQERATSILRVRNATAKIIAIQIDTISVLRTEKAFRGELNKYKSALSEEVRRYNKAGDAYKKVSGKKLAPLKQNLADLVARGAEYEPPRIAEFAEESASIPTISLIPTSEFGLATEPVYENLSGRPRAVSRAERRAMTAEYMRAEAQSRQVSETRAYEGVAALSTTQSTATRDYLAMERMDRHEHREYVKAGEKQVRTLRKQIQEYEKQNKKAKEIDTHAAIVGAIVSLEREICNVYFNILKTSEATGSVQDKKKYTRLAKREIQTYNRRLKELGRYTGVKYPQADITIPDKIAKRKAFAPIPDVRYDLTPEEQRRREAELQRAPGARREKRAEATRGAKQKRQGKQAVPHDYTKAPLTQTELKKFEANDMAVMEARYEEEIRMIDRQIIELERQFTLEPGRIKKQIGKLKKRMREVKFEHREAVRLEKADNARYFAILTVPPTKLVSKNMTLENAVAYQKDLMQLLRERNAINERITSLYRGAERARDAVAEQAEKMYLAEHAVVLKRYDGLIRKIRRLHITIPQKEELFALINQCARDEANVKVEKKKISMFKLRGAARKAQKLNVRKLKDTLRRSKAELERKLQARLDEDYRFIPTEAYVAWFFGILGLVVVVGVLWIFHEPILEWLKGLIGMLIDNNSTGG